MKVDHCIILSAGFGTRMKSIGEIFPKPLWPIFEKSILENQIDYARMLGAKNIYVNLHYRSQQVLQHFYDKEEYEDVHFLVENEILDIGGAIHNMASQEAVNYKGQLLILNGDQFIYFDWSELKKAEKLLAKSKAVMMAVKVDPRFGHAQTIMDENDCLSNIVPNKKIISKEKIYTYSGMCFVKLESLTPYHGPSSLYESVCNYKVEKIPMVKIDNYEYWDFGTLDRYWNSMFEILKEIPKKKGMFVDFLIENKSIDLNKYDEKELSYNSNSNAINLCAKKQDLKQGQILIKNIKSIPSIANPGVIYNDLFEEVSFNQSGL